MKNILIIAGPSAVGKTTIAHHMLELDSRYEFVRSVTTRPCRGDQFNSEYIYISDEEFRHLIATAGVLEHTEYAGSLYGTPRSEIDRITSEGKIPLLILDINGVASLSINKGDISPCGVYLYDDIDVMEGRLYERYKDDMSSPETQRRYNSRRRQNIVDYSQLPERESVFYAFIENCSSVNCCAEKIGEIFTKFCSGTPKDAETNMTVAKQLAATVSDKM
ncbi:MAG: guanylate kinase [Clostridia bacterium]|nr:guanylate kinase [Clostridia bacterium]